MQPGDLIVPKFSQSAEYLSSEEGVSEQRRYCESIGVSYDEVVEKYRDTVDNGTNVVPFIMRVTGATTASEDADGNEWSGVPVQTIPLEGHLSTKDFLLLRSLPENIAAQFKGTVAQGRHLQILPPDTAKSIREAAAATDRSDFLRRYTLVAATTAETAEEALKEHGRPVREGDRVFIASHAGLLGIHEWGMGGHLTPVGQPIAKTPAELLELFQEAKAKANKEDRFAPGPALSAAKELDQLLSGPTNVIPIDDFGKFHNSYVLLASKVTQALDISKRDLPLTTPSGDTSEEGDQDTELDEIAALAGLSIEAVRAELPPEMVIQDSVLAEAVTALRAGKHLLLGGAPGTGKSTLAEALCKAVVGQQFEISTATADWTTFDTIGGYVPREDNSLAFEPGVILRALRRGRWVVLDEMNRADIDKAFGPLFTLLASSGGRQESRKVVLPYQEHGKQIEIRWTPKRSGSSPTEYLVTSGWRLIGTMNISDKASLFQLSFAFLRRFAVIDVPLPPRPEYLEYFLQLCSGIPDPYRGQIVDVGIDLAFGPRQLGPAILTDVAIFLSKALAETASGGPTYTDPLTAFLAAVRLFAVPQYEGASRKDVDSVSNRIKAAWPELSDDALNSLREALNAVALT